MSLVVFLANQLTRGLLVSLIGIVVGKILLGQISLRGVLLGDAHDGHSYFSLGRLQLLLCVLAVTVNYVILMTTRKAGLALPDIRPFWLALFSGSAVMYLVEKGFALWRIPSGTSRERGDNNVQ